MPASDTAGQNFEALAGYISDIEPGTAREELEPFLTGSYGVPLSVIVAKSPIDPENPEDPITHLLGVVREKISQADGKDVPALTVQALGSLAGVFQRREFKPDSYEAVEALVTEIDGFAELIGDDPHRQAEYYISMASSLARMDLSATEHPNSFFGIALSSQYLDKAVESAKAIDDEDKSNERLRTTILTKAAMESVGNIRTAANITAATDGETHKLPHYLYDQPQRLYREAFAAANAMEDRQAFYELQIDETTSAVAIMKQSAEVKDVSSDMHRILLSLTLQRIDTVLTDHESGAMAPWLHPRWHAFILAHIGQDVMITLGQHYDHGEGIEPEGRPSVVHLERRAFTLLRAAAEKVQAMEEPRPEHEDQHPDRSSPNISQAARVFADRDTRKVIHIMDLAFATAVAEDRYEALHRREGSHSYGRDSRDAVGAVLEEARLLASKGRGREGFKDALAVFTHMHGLLVQADAEGHFGEGTAHYFMGQNSDAWIHGLDRGSREDAMILNVSDEQRAFLKFTLEERCTAADLEKMSSLIRDEDLEQVIKDLVRARREADAKAKAEREAPKTQIERLARELVRSLSSD